MSKTTLFRCKAAGCREMIEGDWCDVHKPAEASPPRPAFDPEVYLAPIRAEWEAMGNARREQERADAVGERAMLRHQLEVMRRQGENRQPRFSGDDHGI
jgi:hypothetical protein